MAADHSLPTLLTAKVYEARRRVDINVTGRDKFQSCDDCADS